jgi:uncharacterized protein (TIGR02453 family)
MSHFSPAFITFFKELSDNNSTEWFNANRKTYEKEVKAPFAAFVGEMIARIQQHEPQVHIKPTDAIMRISKDIRFSKDKTPYSTHVAANISPFGKKDKSYPGFFFQFSHEKITIFGGAYMVEPPALEKLRTYISKHPAEFSAAYNDKAFKEKFGGLQGEKSKRIPPEFQSAVTTEPLIANKQFFYSAEIPAENLLKSDLADVLMEYYMAGRKVNGFLQGALKS